MSPRSSFDKALAELQQDILQMGSLVEQSISNAVQSFIKQDVSGASQVIMGDEQIDELFLKIEDKCVKLIATQQPIAKDLRIVMTGVKILLSLERMADHAVDIGRATMCLSNEPLRIKPLEYIPTMAKYAQQMVKDGLGAYINGDVEKARKMCALDDKVDYLFAKVFGELITMMMNNPESVLQAAYFLYVSRYLERIADHATNIGEAVIYLVTGERRELN